MLKTLRKNESGATIVEFGLLLPVILGSLLGVLQAGLGMMTYNSLRNLTAETSRYTLVQYQISNELTTTAIEEDAKARAGHHGFVPADLQISVTPVETPRIEGTTELTMTATYKVMSVMSFMGLQNFDVTFTRPIFLIDETDDSEDGSDLGEGEGEGTDFGEGGIDDGTGSDGGTGGDTGTGDDSHCADPGNCDGTKNL